MRQRRSMDGPIMSGHDGQASGDHAHDVGCLHDQKLVAVELDLGAGPLAEQHPVAGLEVHNNELAVLVAAAGSDGDDLTFLRFLFGAIGNDDAAFGALVGLNPFDDDAVMQGTELKLCHDHPYCRIRRGVRPVEYKSRGFAANWHSVKMSANYAQANRICSGYCKAEAASSSTLRLFRRPMHAISGGRQRARLPKSSRALAVGAENRHHPGSCTSPLSGVRSAALSLLSRFLRRIFVRLRFHQF